MRYPLTPQLMHEAATYRLRSSCVHCAHYVEADGSCAHGWPNEEQRRWPVDAPLPDGSTPTELHVCKEFELL